MSRTDKDAPWWMHSPGVRERHSHYWRKPTCDLPPEPASGTTVRPIYGTTHCVWYPEWPDDNRRRVLWHSRGCPPAWFIDHVGNAPTRVKVRDTCIQARKEYRATGEVDVMPPTNQHRHCGAWLYW